MKSLALPVIFMMTATAAVFAVQKEDKGPPAPQAPAPALARLDYSLAPLQQAFNEGKGKPRILALLAPSCPLCRGGAALLKQALAEVFPEAGASVHLVWMDVLPGDGEDPAVRVSEFFADMARVHQYYDPFRRAGKAAAGTLGWQKNLVWDAFLFYGPGAVWEGEAPPAPAAYMHQLQSRSSDGRYFTGEELQLEMWKAVEQVLAMSAAPPPAPAPDSGSAAPAEQEKKGP
jgi:hypothetical protein